MLDEKKNLDFIKTSIKKKILEINEKIEPSLLSHIEYFSYLERYNTNLLQFSSPQTYIPQSPSLDLEFEKLFKLMVYNYTTKK